MAATAAELIKPTSAKLLPEALPLPLSELGHSHKQSAAALRTVSYLNLVSDAEYIFLLLLISHCMLLYTLHLLLRAALLYFFKLHFDRNVLNTNAASYYCKCIF